MEQKIINCPHYGGILSKDILARKSQEKPKCPECGRKRSKKEPR